MRPGLLVKYTRWQQIKDNKKHFAAKNLHYDGISCNPQESTQFFSSHLFHQVLPFFEKASRKTAYFGRQNRIAPGPIRTVRYIASLRI